MIIAYRCKKRDTVMRCNYYDILLSESKEGGEIAQRPNSLPPG